VRGIESLVCLEASRPDQRHPVEGGAFRATTSRLAALTGCRLARQGLLKHVRLNGGRALPGVEAYEWPLCAAASLPFRATVGMGGSSLGPDVSVLNPS
jgi:hypothetical protein